MSSNDPMVFSLRSSVFCEYLAMPICCGIRKPSPILLVLECCQLFHINLISKEYCEQFSKARIIYCISRDSYEQFIAYAFYAQNARQFI